MCTSVGLLSEPIRDANTIDFNKKYASHYSKILRFLSDIFTIYNTFFSVHTCISTVTLQKNREGIVVCVMLPAYICI